MLKKILILLFMINTSGFAYSQEYIESKDTSEESHQSSPAGIKEKNLFLNWVNSKAYAADKKIEKERLRKDWKEMLGIDVFSPYFKAKKVQKWVKDKARIKLLNIEGEPSLDRNRIQYKFKINF